MISEDDPTTSGDPQVTAWSRRYLAFLGIASGFNTPDLALATRITRAHILAVPFENASCILRRRDHPSGPVPPLDPELVLTSWQRCEAGGVCFVVAEMVWRLLTALGYRAHQVLATISSPGTHQAVVVEIGGARYLVDAGNNALYLEPVPLNRPFEFHRAGLGFRFRPGADAAHWMQDRWQGGEWQPFCSYEMEPAGPEALDAACQRHHTPGCSWVMDQLRLGRCTEDGMAVYRDGSFTVYSADGKRRQEIAGETPLARLATDELRLPAALILESLRVQRDFGRAGPA